MRYPFSISNVFFGWWIVAACFFICAFGTSLVSYSFTSFIEPIAAEFSWSYAQISLAMTLRGVEVGIASPLSGWMIDKWGSRKVVFFGSIITCTGLFLLMQTKSLWMFYLAFVFIGIGSSSCTLNVILPTVAMWFRRHLGLAMGIATSGIGISGLLIPIITYLITSYGWRTAVFAILLLIIIVVLPLSFVLRHKPEQYGMNPDGDTVTEHIPIRTNLDQNTDRCSYSLKQAIRTLTFWQVTVATICLMLVGSAVVTHVMPYLASIGVDRYTASYAASSIPLISVVGRIGFGWFSDRLGRKMVTAVCFLIIFVAMICFWLASIMHVWLIIPFCLFFSVGYGGALILLGSYISELFGRSSFGVIYGLIMGLSVVGHASGAPLAGWAYDTWSTYQWFWFIMIFISLSGSIIILTISKPSLKQSRF